MADGIPSITAAAVSAFRALASLPGSPLDFAGDERMRVLVSAPGARALALLGRLTARRPELHRWLAAPTLGLLHHAALRTAAIDVVLRTELQAGAEQLVILGAGLDARAWRVPELRGTTVFEVDRPSTQHVKRRRVRELPPQAREVRFVAVDFGRDALDDRLAAEGHDVSARTLWLWEGVTPYLVPAAIADTLGVIAGRSAPGSMALVTYTTPECSNTPQALLPIVLAAFALLGEPLRGRLTPAAFRTLVEGAGLTVRGDTDSPAWARAHFRGRPSRIVIREHLAVLEKR
jgi:methyltransferase (TIGR00027 family)